MQDGGKLIPQHGGYRRLKSFQVTQLVYDVTARFCDRFIEKRSRTHDQMVQAARSGAQNIAEGSQASATSKKMELKLTNTARASLEELKCDYEDFLRQRGLALWPRDVFEKESGQGGRSGQGGQGTNARFTSSTSSTSSISSTSSTPSTIPEIAANGVLVLIAVACALLDRQIASQERAFLREGGFTEKLYRIRKQKRDSEGSPG